MNPLDFVQQPRFQKGLATLAAGLAKQRLETQYNRLGETEAVKRIQNLSRPTKLAIELALNLISASLNAYEDKLPGGVLSEFVMQLAQDAPAEISKRILNGDTVFASVQREPGASPAGVAKILQSMAEMDSESLEALLSAARSSTIEERRNLAQALVERIAAEQKAAAPTISSRQQSDQVPEKAGTPTPPSPPQSSAPAKSPSLLSDLAKSMARLNEKFERRSAKKSDIVKGDG